MQGPWRAGPLAQGSGEDQQEETSDLAEIQSTPAAEPTDALDSPVRPLSSPAGPQLYRPIAPGIETTHASAAEIFFAEP